MIISNDCLISQFRISDPTELNVTHKSKITDHLTNPENNRQFKPHIQLHHLTNLNTPYTPPAKTNFLQPKTIHIYPLYIYPIGQTSRS